MSCDFGLQPQPQATMLAPATRVPFLWSHAQSVWRLNCLCLYTWPIFIDIDEKRGAVVAPLSGVMGFGSD